MSLLLRSERFPEDEEEFLTSEFGFNRPAGTGYFPHDSRHFVPGYYHAVPPGQNTSTRWGLFKAAYFDRTNGHVIFRGQDTDAIRHVIVTIERLPNQKKLMTGGWMEATRV